MVKDLPFPCDYNYYCFLSGLKRTIKTGDTQLIGFITGAVGSGKSCRAQEIMYFVNEGNCSIDQIGFDIPEIIKAVLKNHKVCIIGDEGKNMIYNLQSLSKESKGLNQLLDQARTNNLLILFCIPRLTNITKDLLQIGDFCIHVWENVEIDDKRKKKIIKGNMALFLRPDRFGLEGKDSLEAYINYELNKKKDSTKFIPRPMPALTQKGGVFNDSVDTGFYAVDVKEYKKKKIAILEKFLIETEAPKKRSMNYDRELIKKMIEADIPVSKIAKALDISDQTIYNFKKMERIGVNTLTPTN